MSADSFIYLDNHATTRCDRRVIDAMVTIMESQYANPHSATHAFGREVADQLRTDLESIASHLGCDPSGITITSGATESANLAILGLMQHPRQRRKKIITVATEHPAVLDPIRTLGREGFEWFELPVAPKESPHCGQVDLSQLTEAIDEETALVSVMWANNEIGVLQPMQQIAEICHAAGAILHCDATQAIGRLPVDLSRVDIDLLSCSAHKFHGPKGTGMLVAGPKARRIRLKPLCYGGGQQRALRPGTMNPAALHGMTIALDVALDSLAEENRRIAAHRDRLWNALQMALPDISLNGPRLDESLRLPGNLNVCFHGVDGETLLLQTPRLCASSGSACSSVDATPSPELRAIGMSETDARSSLRFGLSRFTTDDEIRQAAEMLINAYRALRGG